jgi:hypothetical protein
VAAPAPPPPNEDDEKDEEFLPGSFQPDERQEVDKDGFANSREGAEFAFAGKDTADDRRRALGKQRLVDWKETDAGEYLIVETSFDPNAIEPISCLEMTRKNLLPDDPNTWTQNNGKRWAFQAGWWSLTDPEGDGACRDITAAFKPYMVPKECADRFKAGTQPDDAFDFEKHGFKSKVLRRCVQFFDDRQIGPHIIEGQVVLNKDGTLHKNVVKRIRKNHKNLMADFNVRYEKLVVLDRMAAAARETEYNDRIQGAVVPFMEPGAAVPPRRTMFKPREGDDLDSVSNSSEKAGPVPDEPGSLKRARAKDDAVSRAKEPKGKANAKAAGAPSGASSSSRRK